MEEIAEVVLNIVGEAAGVMPELGGDPESRASSPASAALEAITQVRALAARIGALEQENAALSAFILSLISVTEKADANETADRPTNNSIRAKAIELLSAGALETRNSLRTLAGLPILQRKKEQPRPEGQPPTRPAGVGPGKPLPPQKPKPRSPKQ